MLEAGLAREGEVGITMDAMVIGWNGIGQDGTGRGRPLEMWIT